MKLLSRVTALALLLSAGVFTSQAIAAPRHGLTPLVETNRVDARQTCHHYRSSSRRHCTSAQVLRYVARPPLFYPHKYYGGTPHYFARQPVYWHAHPAYYHHRWHYWRHRHHPFYWR